MGGAAASGRTPPMGAVSPCAEANLRRSAHISDSTARAGGMALLQSLASYLGSLCPSFDARIRAGRSSSARPAWEPGWRSPPAREPAGLVPLQTFCPRPGAGRSSPLACRAATCGMGARSCGAAWTGRRKCRSSGPPLRTCGERHGWVALARFRKVASLRASTCRAFRRARRSSIGSSFGACSTPER